MAGTVVVLGAGLGGVVAARRARRLLDSGNRVVLVDREPVHRFPPSFLWVMSGARRPAQVTARLDRLRRHGIDVLCSEALDIDTTERTVMLEGQSLAYDRLVIALGAEAAPDAMPGFSQTAHDVYTIDGAAAAGRALREFRGGRVVILVSSLPYKCPAAPYEAALLAETVLRDRGVRGRSRIDVYAPEPSPMPVAGPAVGRAVAGILEARGIGLHAGRSAERIDPGRSVITFGDGDGPAAYDLLLGIPPHRGPDVLRRGGLAAESGFVPVDRSTLATSAEGVFAVGDATTIPIAGGKLLPKAGVFAHAQARVVAERIAHELSGRAPSASFDGGGSCFLEVGGGRAAYASGDFYADEAPDVRLHVPGRRWHLAKIAHERFWFRRWL